MGFILLLTEHKYSVAVLRNNLLLLYEGVSFVPTCPVFAGTVT